MSNIDSVEAASRVLLVLTTVPDATSAERIATELVSARLAACVNIGAPVTSLYHWRRAIEKSTEIPLTIKTTAARYVALEDRLRALHPYELPEILAVAAETGLAEYVRWVAAETAATGTSV